MQGPTKCRKVQQTALSPIRIQRHNCRDRYTPCLEKLKRGRRPEQKSPTNLLTILPTMSLLMTPIESAAAPSFFDLAIQTRDQAILEKDRAIYELMEDMKAKDRIINELCHQVFQQRTALSEKLAKSELAAAAELLTSCATSAEEASASDSSASTMPTKSHKQLKYYCEDGDIIHHNITKCNSWSATWDRATNKLVRSEGQIYNSPSQFAAAHRTACGKKPACNAWAECTVLRMDAAGEWSHVYIKDLERQY